MEFRGNIFTSTYEIKKGIVRTENDVITEIIFDDSITENQLIIPGLIDIHLHGANGYDICDGTVEAINRITEYENKHGIVAYCGATMTISDHEVKKVMMSSKIIDDISFKGIYLEGPFISEMFCGAQNKECIQKPDYKLLDELQKMSEGRIKIVVVAPEKDGSDELIKYATRNGIICSIGHSAADYNTAVKAFDNGVTEVTHLFNAMEDMKKRSPGIQGAAFDKDAYVEIISDGNHISDTMLRMAFKIYDEDKILLISDSMRATGLTDGKYTLGGQLVNVNTDEHGITNARLEDGVLAGSATNLMDCLRIAISKGVPLTKAIKAATINPAKRLGIDNMYGSIEIGKYRPVILENKTAWGEE